MTTEEHCPSCDTVTEVDSYRGGRCSNDDCQLWVLPCGTCPSIHDCKYNGTTGECAMFERNVINEFTPTKTEVEFKFLLNEVQL